MKVLVTGANGYLGRGIVRQLLDNGCVVIAADLTVDGIDNRAVKYACNIFEVENPYIYFSEPDVLLHLAWRDGFIHNSINHINDLPFHFQFLKLMVESEVKRISIMGTMHEIGLFEGSINENTQCNPLNLYGIAKDALRKSVALLTQDNKIFQWLRGFYIVGNSEYGNSVFSKITAAEKKGASKFPFTMGQNQYDFIDYSDFCFQVAAVIEQEEVNGIINICSGKPEKLCNRVEKFIQENRFNIRLEYGVFPDRKYDSLAVWGNDLKIQRILKLREDFK